MTGSFGLAGHVVLADARSQNLGEIPVNTSLIEGNRYEKA